jgi:hypothetical protein
MSTGQEMLSADSRSEPMIIAAPSPRRRRRVFLRILLLFMTLMAGWFFLGQPAVRKHQLASACASADRIVLAYRTAPERTNTGWTKGERLTLEIVGPEKVRSFLATVEPRASIPYRACRCSTVPVMEVTQGGQVLAKLTLHHDQALRWWDGPWTGDTRLSKRSVEALQAWIKQEGGAELSQLEAKLDTLWTQYQAAREAEYKAEEAASTRPAEHVP